MTTLIFSIIIIAITTLKPFVNKPIAKAYPAEVSSAFTACWMVASVLLSVVMMPMLTTSLIDWDAVKEYWPRLSLSIIKGILLWYLIKFMQVINRESTSSSVFFMFISFAIGSTLNNLLFQEGLPVIHLFAFIGFGVLAVFFRYFGDMNTLSKNATIAFWICVTIVAFFQCADHLVTKTAGWYPHLAISSIVMFGCALVSNVFKKINFSEMFVNKYMLVAGLVYVVSEYVVLYASGRVMAVSYVTLSLRMANPIIMLLSAFLYKEKTPLNQALFALVAILLASVIIFF